MFERRRLGIGQRNSDRIVRRLLDEGLSLRAVMPVLNAFELHAIGSAWQETQNADEQLQKRDAEFPDLARARRETGLAGEALLKLTMSSIIDTVLAATEDERMTPKKPAKKARPRKTLPAAQDAVPAIAEESRAKTARSTANGDASRKTSASLQAPIP